MRVRSFLRRWWPTLALLALGLLSVELLRWSHLRSQETLQQTIASLDNVSESRRRLIQAYLIHDRKAAGDATFEGWSAVAELRAAEYALRNWLGGQSAILELRATAPADAILVPMGEAYMGALSRFRTVIGAADGDAVELHRSFSAAEEAAAALESAIHAVVRDSVRAEERAFHYRLGGWGLLLLVSVVGATYARQALKESETQRVYTESRLARLRALAPVGIVECNGAGRVLAANPMWSSLTRRTEEEWRGRPWWNALEGNDRERARALWRQDGRDSEITVEARLDRGDGPEDPTWLLIRGASGVTDGSARSRRVVTFTDITQQRRVEDQLHHAQRMEAVGQLAGGVAHDFNNLLTGIRGFATLALEQARGNDDLTTDLLEIERAADRGRALTRQLLTFSRQNRTDPKVVDAATVVRGVQRMLGRLVPDVVEFEIVANVASAHVFIDEAQLEQVITNLVVNAADAMAGHGRIRIGVESVAVEESFRGAKSEIQPGDYVLLSVSDTGPGIPPPVRERMFEPFFTTKEQGKGTGLGLSTVWAIVRQAGGHIHVYSVIGQGTVFKIYLPTASEAAPPEQTPAEPAAEAPTDPGTALVVEDEDAVRRLTCRVLERSGWTVLQAADGEEALRIMDERGGAVDLLVTDLTMPRLGGAELAERLRERGFEVPTLFVSGFADSEVELRGKHFLEKPFTPAALVRSVDAAVKGSR